MSDIFFDTHDKKWQKKKKTFNSDSSKKSNSSITQCCHLLVPMPQKMLLLSYIKRNNMFSRL